jgi:hypothetical protein
MRVSSSRNQIELHAVRLECVNEQAEAVAVTGAFSHWRAVPLVHLGAGRWLRIVFVPPGVYEYRFVFDGRIDGSRQIAIVMAPTQPTFLPRKRRRVTAKQLPPSLPRPWRPDRPLRVR